MKTHYEGIEIVQGKVPKDMVKVWQYRNRDISVYAPRLVAPLAKMLYVGKDRAIRAYYWPQIKLYRFLRKRVGV